MIEEVTYCKCNICGKVYEKDDNCTIALPGKRFGKHTYMQYDVCPKCDKKWRKALKPIFGKQQNVNDDDSGVFQFFVKDFKPEVITGNFEIEGKKVD